MSLEIERKFLVKSDEWWSQVLSVPSLLKQGYITVNPEVRVRIQSACTVEGQPFGKLSASLSVLGDRTAKGEREVFDFNIPVEDAKQMLCLSKYQLKKIRHKAEMNLTVDQFLDRENNIYLTVAELKIIKNRC
jgi:CYTH domain-containing protein